MSRVRDLSIGKKLYAGFGVIILLLAVTGGVALWGSSSQVKATETVIDLEKVSEAMGQARYDIADMNGWQTAYAFDIQRNRAAGRHVVISALARAAHSWRRSGTSSATWRSSTQPRRWCRWAELWLRPAAASTRSPRSTGGSWPSTPVTPPSRTRRPPRWCCPRRSRSTTRSRPRSNTSAPLWAGLPQWQAPKPTTPPASPPSW